MPTQYGFNFRPLNPIITDTHITTRFQFRSIALSRTIFGVDLFSLLVVRAIVGHGNIAGLSVSGDSSTAELNPRTGYPSKVLMRSVFTPRRGRYAGMPSL